MDRENQCPSHTAQSAVISSSEKPVVKIDTDTEIGKDGSARIVSDLEIHAQSGSSTGQTPADPPQTEPAGQDGAVGPQG